MDKSYYIFSNGKMRRREGVVRIKREDGLFKDIQVEMASDIYLFGEVELNTKCLNYLGQCGINLHIFNYYGYYTGSFFPKESNVSGALLVKQVEYFADNEKRLEIAKKIVYGASHNIRRNLRYYNSRGRELSEFIVEIDHLRHKIKETKDVEELMGVEGNIRKIYYSCWNSIVNQKIDFNKRVKRPPDNMINTLISFINTLNYTTTLGEIYKTQLNPTISYLHAPGSRRFSLSLDISEIFKPLIVDRMIFSILNKKVITEKDFESRSNFYCLKEKGRQKILEEYEERLKKTVMHKVLRKKVSYKHLIKLECYKLIKHLTGEKEYEPFEMWW